jgi:hypothetical protein
MFGIPDFICLECIRRLLAGHEGFAKNAYATSQIGLSFAIIKWLHIADN